jgi:acyl-homoserine lactone acylase PvdQ
VISRALRAVGVATALAAATVSLTWGLLFYRPLPTIDGYYRLLGLHERGEVVRDVYGIPRVYAQDAHDVFFLQGYVTAQDRLAQMDALRSAARKGGPGVAGRVIERSTPALRDALDAYAAGVTKLTHQLADARALPGELVVAGRRPADWSAADSIAIVAAYVERMAGASVCVSAPATATLKGRPVLVADVYVGAPEPGLYELGIDGGGIRALGASLPGVPGIVAGHNGWVAWALLSSARRGTADPSSTLAALLDAMTQHSAAGFVDAMRRSAVAACVADVAGRAGGSDRDLSAFVPPDRPAVLGGDGGRGAALAEALERARGVDLEAMRALLGRPRASVGARILIDLADVDTSRSASSHGASAQRASPHYRDQSALWELGQVHRLPFSRGAIGRTDGQLVFRAR